MKVIGRSLPEIKIIEPKVFGDEGGEFFPYTFCELDICDEAAVSATVAEIAPAVVINAAAYTAVDMVEKESQVAYAVNADGAAYLALACSAT